MREFFVKNSQSVTLNLFFVSAFCNAMDQQKNYLYTIAWSGNKIFIGDGTRCFSFNPETKKKFVLCKKPTHHIVTNLQQPLIAISNETMLKIYDSNTHKEVWSKKNKIKNASAPFFCRKNAIGIFHDDELTIYSYQGNTSISYKLLVPSSPTISYCSQMNELAFVHDDSAVLIFHPYFPTLIKKCETQPVISCEFCINGAIIAANEINTCHIYNLRDPHCSYHLKNFSTCSIQSLAFHPNRPILAILATIYDPLLILYHYQDVIQYWNPIRKKLIDQTPALNFPKGLPTAEYKTRRLAFSPEGNKLVYIIDNVCEIVDVPPNNTFLFYLLLRKENMPTEVIAKIFNLINWIELAYT